MKKLITGIIVSIVLGVVGTGLEVKMANNKTKDVDLNKTTEVKVEKSVDSDNDDKNVIIKKENTEKDEENTQKNEENSKSNNSANNSTNNQITKSKANNNKNQNQKENNIKADAVKPQEKEQETQTQEVPKTTTPQQNNTNANNNVSTSFYDSITHGQKEFATESACSARGTQIQNNELNYVLDWNEKNPHNQISPDINYFRCYPVVDSNGEGWYLHFFCGSGEGNDAKLKSMF